MRIVFIILAAGRGKRFGLHYNKLFYKFGNKPLITHLLHRVEQFKQIKDIILVTDKTHLSLLKRIVKEENIKKVIKVLEGGKERQDSVFRALQWIKRSKLKNIIVGIHDGARLNISEQLIDKLIDAVKKYSAVIPGISVTDTIKSIKDGFVDRTIPRKDLWKIATPQFFKLDMLFSSYVKASMDRIKATDDSAILEYSNYKVKIIEGEFKNIKLTYMNDLKYMINKEYRIGQGFDIHRTMAACGRKLILGGIRVKSRYILEGHSDADVLIHAVIDAILGACGLNDIGHHFPDTDIQYKNINSVKLLKNTISLMEKENYSIVNLDTTIFAESPRLGPVINKIRESLSREMGIDKGKVNIKAKTMEKLGPIGNHEGIAAQAIVLVTKMELN